MGTELAMNGGRSHVGHTGPAVSLVERASELLSEMDDGSVRKLLASFLEQSLDAQQADALEGVEDQHLLLLVGKVVDDLDDRWVLQLLAARYAVGEHLDLVVRHVKSCENELRLVVWSSFARNRKIQVDRIDPADDLVVPDSQGPRQALHSIHKFKWVLHPVHHSQRTGWTKPKLASLTLGLGTP